PATAHLIAWRLSVLLHKPWVADFRDPWIEDPPEPQAPSGAVFRSIDKWLEKKVISCCAHVTASTSDLRDALVERYPSQPRTKFSAIPNGYDEADFAQLPHAVGVADGRLNMLHAGNINPEFRDPR